MRWGCPCAGRATNDPHQSPASQRRAARPRATPADFAGRPRRRDDRSHHGDPLHPAGAQLLRASMARSDAVADGDRHSSRTRPGSARCATSTAKEDLKTKLTIIQDLNQQARRAVARAPRPERRDAREVVVDRFHRDGRRRHHHRPGARQPDHRDVHAPAAGVAVLPRRRPGRDAQPAGAGGEACQRRAPALQALHHQGRRSTTSAGRQAGPSAPARRAKPPAQQAGDAGADRHERALRPIPRSCRCGSACCCWSAPCFLLFFLYAYVPLLAAQRGDRDEGRRTSAALEQDRDRKAALVANLPQTAPGGRRPQRAR